MAGRIGGACLLRIEDTDSARCRPEHVQGIFDDLRWLGLDWPEPVRHQSRHFDDYERVLAELDKLDVVYPCNCSRAEIRAAGGRHTRHATVYPGTCRGRSMASARPGEAIRLDLSRAADIVTSAVFHETGSLHDGRHNIEVPRLSSELGDPVVKRRLTGDPAYLLASACDDALQGITLVVRGVDIWPFTGLQVVLQRLLGWPTPDYHHHDLIRDPSGRRLAKIDRSRALAAYRQEGASPQDIRELIAMS